MRRQISFVCKSGCQLRYQELLGPEAPRRCRSWRGFLQVVAASFVSALHWPLLLASFQQCQQWGSTADCRCACRWRDCARLL